MAEALQHLPVTSITEPDLPLTSRVQGILQQTSLIIAKVQIMASGMTFETSSFKLNHFYCMNSITSVDHKFTFNRCLLEI